MSEQSKYRVRESQREGRSERARGSASEVLVSRSDISCHAAHWTGHSRRIHREDTGVKVARTL